MLDARRRRELELISRSAAVAPAIASGAASDVGRPGAVDSEGYIASLALGLPRAAAATVTDAAAALAAAPARFTRASVSREHSLISRRTGVAPAFAPAKASGVNPGRAPWMARVTSRPWRSGCREVRL